MTNVEIIRKWYEEVWNKRNEEAIDELFAETCIAHGLFDEAGNEIKGPANFKPFFKKFIQSFPDLYVTVEDVVAQGDMVATRCSVTCTHSGEKFAATAKNIVEPSKKTYTFSGMSFTSIKNGQLQEGWNNWDFLSLYMQMGVV